jgi:hypothetical protein
MTTVNFPTPTSVGQTYTFGSRTWTWTGDFWMATSTTVGYTGSQGVGYTGSTGPSGSATNPWHVVTTDYTAIDGDRIIANTIYGSFNITLPSSPTAGQYIQITDGYNLTLYPVTVLRNGSTIEGYSDNVSLDLTGSTFEFIYSGSTWQVTSTTGPKGNIGYTGSMGAGVITLNQPGNLVVFQGTARWYAPYACTITTITPRVRVAATVDIISNVIRNNDIYQAVTIPANQTTGSNNTGTFDMSAGDYLTVNVTQTGFGTGSGQDLYVQVQYLAI